MLTGFCLGNVIKRNHLQDPGTDGRIILKWILRCGIGAWTGLFWLKTEPGVRLLRIW